MRILITGSEGCLGKALTKELRSQSHHVIGCDLFHSKDDNYIRADVADARQIRSVFRIYEPVLVYHFAAEFGRRNGEEYYEQLWRTNCIGTRNVIDNCVRYRSHLVFASSSEAYGLLASDKPLEEEILSLHPTEFHNEYALTKYTNEHQIAIARRNKKLRATILRFFNVYGPGEEYSPYRSVVCLFVYSLLKGKPISVYSDSKRTHCYIDDWARTVAAISNKYPSLDGEAINIGGDELTSTQNIIDHLYSISPLRFSNIAQYMTESNNVAVKVPDLSKAIDLLGHVNNISLKEGLSRTLEWQEDYYANDSGN